MFEDLNDLYQQVILDHSRSPRNFGKLDGATHSAQGHNPNCGDHVTLYLVVKEGVIQDVRFEGDGCAIFKSSASLLTENLKGKTVEEARALFLKIRELVTSGKNPDDSLGKLAVLSGVHRYPARVKCAILPWHAVVAAVDGEAQPVSTE